MKDCLNATTWANHYDWPIKISHFLLLTVLEITIICCAYLQVQSQFHTS
jgi:hypothetical protein